MAPLDQTPAGQPVSSVRLRRRRALGLIALWTSLALPPTAVAQAVPIAVGAAPIQSATGRFVAFVSDAGDLVSGDTNGVTDVFVHDRDADANGVFDEPGRTRVERIDVSTGGVQANAPADFRIALSADGRYVAFASTATNLVPAAPDGQRIYRRDRLTGTTRLVSDGALGPDERFGDPTITLDGRYVTFLRERGERDPIPYPGSMHLARGTQALLADLDAGVVTVLSEPLPADDERHQWAIMAPRVSAAATHAFFTIRLLNMFDGRVVTRDTSMVLRDLRSGGRRVLHTGVPGAGISDDGRVIALANVPYGMSFLDVESGRIDHIAVLPPYELADDGVRISGDGRSAYGKCYRVTRVPPYVPTVQEAECLFERATLRRYVWMNPDWFTANGSWGSLDRTGRFLAYAGQDSGVSVLDLAAHFDAGGLDGRWKQTVGLGVDDGPDGDPDGDGRSNLEEYLNGGLPVGGSSQFLAEGAAGPYFHTSFAIVNPAATPALVSVRHIGETEVAGELMTLPPMSRRTVEAGDASGIPGAFGTIIEAIGTVAVERTVRWAGGGHSQSTLPAASATWYLAEGSVSAVFDLFYLLINPGRGPVSATVTYLQPGGGAPVTRTYQLPAASRTTVYVNADTALGTGDRSAAVTATGPIVVERAMYLRSRDGAWLGGTASAGVAQPSTTWYFAEGATGPFFETFVALANPSDQAADVEGTFLTAEGERLTKTYVLPPRSRTTLWIDEEAFAGRGKALAATDVAMVFTARNGVPIVAERIMWWPGGGAGWRDGHSSPGTAAPGSRWVAADGAEGGPERDRTFLLVANVGPSATALDVTLLLENGTTSSRRFSAAPGRRLTLPIHELFALPDGMRFGVIVESPDPAAALVVERATYWDLGGVTWGGGAGAPAVSVPRATP
jgi:hypothetical protein